MSFHVLARKGCDVLESIVFHAGQDSASEAVAVFTNPQAAKNYLSESHWERSDEVRRLSPADLLAWMLHAREGGVQHVTVNPVRREQIRGYPQPALSIEDVLNDLGGRLEEILAAPPPPGPLEFERISIYHCETCGKVRRQPQHQRQPRCCSELMAKAAEDSSNGHAGSRTGAPSAAS